MNPAVSSIDIGDACFCQGDYYRALEHYFPALRVLEKGSQLLDTASLFYSIGASYDQLGRSSDALRYYHKALDIMERVLGQHHPETAKIYKSIARIYGESGCSWYFPEEFIQ